MMQADLHGPSRVVSKELDGTTTLEFVTLSERGLPMARTIHYVETAESLRMLYELRDTVLPKLIRHLEGRITVADVCEGV